MQPKQTHFAAARLYNECRCILLGNYWHHNVYCGIASAGIWYLSMCTGCAPLFDPAAVALIQYPHPLNTQQIVQPAETTPNQGVIKVGAELPPMCCQLSASQRLPEQAAILAQRLQHIVGACIDPAQLVIASVGGIGNGCLLLEDTLLVICWSDTHPPTCKHPTSTCRAPLCGSCTSMCVCWTAVGVFWTQHCLPR